MCKWIHNHIDAQRHALGYMATCTLIHDQMHPRPPVYRCMAINTWVMAKCMRLHGHWLLMGYNSCHIKSWFHVKAQSMESNPAHWHVHDKILPSSSKQSLCDGWPMARGLKSRVSHWIQSWIRNGFRAWLGGFDWLCYWTSNGSSNDWTAKNLTAKKTV
jgi:hypothetical protein